MIKYVVFDWNGTLLADTALRYHLANASLRKMGHPGITRAEHRKHLVIPIRQFFANLGIPDEVYVKAGEQERIDFHKGYEAGAAKARTRQGARAMLDELYRRGIRRVILSNHTVVGIEIQLKRLGLAHHFDDILANDNIHTSSSRGKLELMRMYLEQRQLNPQEGVIVGDTTEEIHIGKELGLKTVAITGGIHTRQRLAGEHPDAVIGRLYGLIDVLEEIA
jgi:phosphoglycolate phosphatase